MKKGDILLIDYKYDPIGWLIKLATKSKYNHVAWALNEFVLIEATGRGIKTTPLSKYLNSPLYSMKLIRFTDLCKTKIKKISKHLLKQRCKTPYWKFFISYFLVFLGFKPLCQNCSLFIYKTLRKEDCSLGKRNNRFINPEDFNSYQKAVDVSEELPCGVKHTWKLLPF
jgi:hypothetical protein